MDAKLNYKQIITDASNRFNAIVNACMNTKDYNTIVGLTCASLYGGEDTIPQEKEQASVIKYQYKDGLCSFVIDGIEIEVQDLRGMRESPRVGKELYADICVPTISYTDEDGMYMYHVVPNTWLYGSTSDEFNEGKPVHQEFIDAAREYIKEHNITKEMQEAPND